MIITAAHVTAAGFCINLGARKFCKRHNLDFRKFVREGIDEAELVGIDDAMLKKVLEEAHRGR